MSDDLSKDADLNRIVGAVQAEVKIFTKQQGDFQKTMFKLHGKLKEEVTQRIDNTLASIPCSERAERLTKVEAQTETNRVVVHELAGTVAEHEEALAPIIEEREKEEETAVAQEEEKRGVRIEVKSAIYIAAIMALFKLSEKLWSIFTS